MSEDIFEQAAHWHAAQVGDDMDWDAFTRWLEADARHREAFDEVALLDERIDSHRDALLRTVRGSAVEAIPARIPAPRRAAARWVVAGTAAAAAIGVVTLQQSRPDVGSPVEYRAGATVRTVNLGAGAKASLAPGSVLVATAGSFESLRLSGRALFDVAHNPARKFVVSAEGYHIRDIGTRFEVATAGGMMRVAVARGSVAVTPPGEIREIEVSAGRSLTFSAKGRMWAGTARAQDLGSWRAGPLVYDQVPLSIVAADVERASGVSVKVDPAIRGRRFSGVLASAPGARMTAMLAAMADLEESRNGAAITLRDRPAR